MGPRLEGRGNLLAAGLEPAGFSLLQWGRVLKDAEMEKAVIESERHMRGFNGAAS